MNAKRFSGLAAACALAAFTLTACGRGRPTSPAPAGPFPAAVQLYYDNGGGIQDSLRSVVRQQAEFQRLWQNATSKQSSPPTAPQVDFGRDMVVVVSSGRLTPDDQIRVDSVGITREMNAAGRMAEVLNVFVRTTMGCRRFNADAYPLEIVRLRRFDGQVKFVERRGQAEGCREQNEPHAPRP